MSSVNETYDQIGKASAIIMLLSLVDKLLALAKEMLVAKQFGVSVDLDVFNVAYAFPGISILLFGGAFAGALVPLYLDWSGKTTESQANAHARGLLYIAIVFFAVVTLICYLLSPWIFRVTGYGFDPALESLGISIERLLILLIFLDGTGIVFRGLLHARKKFFSLYVAPTFINAIIIFLLLFGRNLGIYALVWGFLLGTLMKTLYMAAALSQGGFELLARPSFERTSLVAFGSLALPLLGSNLIANSNILLDQVMATQLSAGSVSTLRYAYRINDLPIQVIIIAISRAIFPFVTELAISRDYDGMKHIYKHCIIFLGFLTFPVICLIGLFSEDVVILLLRRGAFDTSAARETAKTLVLYSYGLFFYAYTFINGTFFSALKDTKPLLYIGFGSIVLNALLNIIFMRFFEVKGIALSTTVTLGLVSLTFISLLKRRLQIKSFADIYANFAWLIMASLATFGFGLLLKRCFQGAEISRMIFLPLIITLVGIFYLVAVRLCRTKELDACLSIPARMLSILWKR